VFLRIPFGFHLTVDTLSSKTSSGPGQRGITPAFGYSAPYPSAEGTSTLMMNALPSAHYDPSDFLTIFPASSLFTLVRRYCPPRQNSEDLPRSPCYFDNMPCSQTPGTSCIATHITMPDGVFWLS